MQYKYILHADVRGRLQREKYWIPEPAVGRIFTSSYMYMCGTIFLGSKYVCALFVWT